MVQKFWAKITFGVHHLNSTILNNSDNAQRDVFHPFLKFIF